MALLYQNLNNAAVSAPEHEAFRCGKKTICYLELQKNASKLAALLLELGVRPEDRVGIRLPPCIEAAVAVYGIMKAGAAFVPIDPFAPDQRLCELLVTGGIRHLITFSLSENTIQALDVKVPNLRAVIGVSREGSASFASVAWDAVYDCDGREDVVVSADAPAYVIFTSGSTGKPKGIVHSHFSGQSYARLSVEAYGLSRKDRIANLSPLHFDMSTFGFLSAPLVAATTVLISPAYSKLPASLSQLVEEERISVWYSVPFALIQLLERGVLDQRDCSSLRWVLFGGEPFAPRHLNALRMLWPQAAFSNVYGPAEVNQCSHFDMPALAEGETFDLEDSNPVPIGAVWGETKALIIDDDDHVVETDEQGELLIHSTTMMSRYWDGTATDSQTFYTSPLDGLRYYRTGDLVTCTDQEVLFFLGRKDRQVKVRGYRIELDEIEHMVGQYPDVAEAVAFCGKKEDTASIILVVRPNKGVEIIVADLQRFLAGLLAAYAIPEEVYVRHELPRTTSGKVDRRILKGEVLGNLLVANSADIALFSQVN